MNSKRAFEEISEQIKERVYAGVFKSGDKLPSERELAIQFKAGRMVVREALRTLEESGLVQIKQGSMGGAFIKNIDTTPIARSISDLIKIGDVTLRELTETRLGIEKLMLEYTIPRITDQELELLKTNLEETEDMISKGIKVREHNITFHLILARASKNYLFQMITESIMKVVSSFIQPFAPSPDYTCKVLRYHKEIYQAIKEKNVAKAKKAMEIHLLEVGKNISTKLSNTQAGFMKK